MSLDVTDPSTSPQGALTDGRDTSTAATGEPCSHPAQVRSRMGPGSGLRLFSPTGSREWPGPGALLLEAAGPHTGEQAAGVRSAGGTCRGASGSAEGPSQASVPLQGPHEGHETKPHHIRLCK